MAKRTKSPPQPPVTPPPLAEVPDPYQRDKMEFVRFPTKEDLLRALGMFREVTSPEIYFTWREEFPRDTAITNTATVRALRKFGINFEWLTKDV